MKTDRAGSTRSLLEALSPGQRLSGALLESEEEARLLLAPLDDDGALRERLASVTGQPHVGVAWLDADGIFNFASVGCRPQLLGKLAAWVARASRSAPEAQALRNTRLHKTDLAGEIVDTFQHPMSWSGISARPPGGSLARSASAVAALLPGSDAWMWFSRSGALGGAHLIIEPQESSATPADLARWIAGARGADAGHRGVLKRLAEGELTFLVQGSAAPVAAELGAVVAELSPRFPILDRLREVRVIGLKGSEAASYAVVPGDRTHIEQNLSALSEALQSLGDEPSLFWFTTCGPDGDPLLEVRGDKDQLIAWADAHNARSPSPGIEVRGRIVAKGGRLFLETWDGFSSLEEELTAWATRRAAQWPALAALGSAQVILRQADES